MSKKGQLPDLLFVKPIGGGKTKAEHKHVVFIVEEWDAQGRPLMCRLCADDEKTVDVEDFSNRGGEFMTAYIQSQMLEPHRDRVNKKMKETP